MLYKLIQPVLFRIDAERSHNIALSLLDLAYGNPLSRRLANALEPTSPVNCMGLNFPNRIGLAAGLDKNADHLTGLGTLGFGFIEVGTVTPRPQSGNPMPRLFRLAKEQAIINRLGFNNKGVDHLVTQLKQRDYKGILGINIGKNADTALDDAESDYVHCLNKVYDYADYVTVNISSPNTPGLRDLQHGDMLRQLFSTLKTRQNELADQQKRYVPIAVKIAPDMTDTEIAAFADAALEAKIDAVIATNTTFSRTGVEQSEHCDETGGLSGKPLRGLATQTIKTLGTCLANNIPIIAAGGVDSVEAMQEKLNAGAALVQVYSGLIYQGPQLVTKLVTADNKQ